MMTFTIPDKPVPAVRQAEDEKLSKPAKRALLYQLTVGMFARSVIRSPLAWEYIDVQIAIYLKMNKKRQLPGNRGEWDDYARAICDGLRYGNVFMNDRCIARGAVDVLPCATEAEERAEVTLSERVLPSA